MNYVGFPVSEAAKSRSLENPSVPLSSDDDRLYEWFGAERSTSGVRVSSASAMSHAAVWRAVNLIASDIAKTPLVTYRRTDKGLERARTHPLHNLLRYKPNDEQTAFIFWQTMFSHVLGGNGNAYAYVVRAGTRVAELIPIDPTAVTPVRVNGRLWYAVSLRGTPSPGFVPVGEDSREVVLLPAADVLHFRGLGWDGLVGYNPIAFHRETIGAGLAMREHGSRFFSNAARGGLLFEYPGVMSEDAQRRFLSAFENRFAGLSNAHRSIVLENGMKAQPLAWNAADTQFIESMQFNVGDVALIYGVPAVKLGLDSRVSYSSLEAQEQSYLNEALDPRLRMAEMEIRDKLVSERNKASDSIVVEFKRESLVRADLATRTESFSKAIGGAPFMTVNEARDGFNLPKVDGGDDLNQPLNMGDPGGDPTKPPVAPADEPDPGADSEDQDPAERAVRALVERDAARMRSRLCIQAKKAATTRAKFAAWLDSFAAANAEPVTSALEPGVTALVALRGGHVAEETAEATAHVFGDVWTTCSDLLATSATFTQFQRDLKPALDELAKGNNHGT